MALNFKIGSKELFYITYAVVFSLVFFIFIGGLFGHKIDHEQPYTYFALDSFSHLGAEQALAKQGNYNTEPAYRNAGVPNGIPHYGPGEVHLTYLFSRMSGIKDYDAMFLLTALMILLMPLILALALKIDWYKKMLALAILPFIFKPNFEIGYIWGQVGAIYGTFFLMTLFLAVASPHFRKNGIVLALLFSAAAITHFPEFFFMALFYAIYIIATTIKEKNFNFKSIIRKNRHLLALAVIFLIFTSYYLVIFSYGDVARFSHDGSSTRAVGATSAQRGFLGIVPMLPKDFKGLKAVTFSNFNIVVRILILMGIIYALFSMNFYAKIVLFFMLAISYLNMFPFFPTAAYRAFQQRTFWPITLAPFFALAVFLPLSYIFKSKKTRAVVMISLTVAFFVFSFVPYSKFSGPGIGTKQQYEAINFVDNLQPQNARVLLLYGDFYSQMRSFIQKTTYTITQNDQEKLLRNETDINQTLEFDTYNLGTPSAFKNGRIVQVKKNLTINSTICDFDYIMFDRTTLLSSPGIIINQLAVEKINPAAVIPVFINNQTVVLKVNNKRCFNGK